jgi:hypothetical protein
MPEKQGALRAAIRLFCIVIWCILDAKPSQDTGDNQIPDQNDDSHDDPRVTKNRQARRKFTPEVGCIQRNPCGDKLYVTVILP